jgi:hypothetical protein
MIKKLRNEPYAPKWELEETVTSLGDPGVDDGITLKWMLRSMEL